MSETAASAAVDGGYILALDAGGTMTDAILVKPNGDFTVGKSITRRDDEPRSYREAVADAAHSIGVESADVHAACTIDIYCGTGMLNTILTGTGRRIGLLVTRGFEDITTMEGGLTYLGQTQAETLHQQLHRHPRSLIDHLDVAGVSERVCGGSLMGDSHLPAGHVLIPLNENDVRKGAQRLIDRGVETIGILFLYSFALPAHEHRAKEIVLEMLAERGVEMPVLCSVDVAPVSRENNRLKSLLFQCFAAEEIRSAYLDVEREAKKQGYKGRLLTLLSYGGAVNMEYPRFYETMISGPIGGLMGAQFVGDLLNISNIVTADMGGTSFDVGLIIGGRIGIKKSADIAGHRLALPMVELDSIGSGAGAAVTLDEYKRLHIGPDSAGAAVGCCLDYDKLTITDINVALGYVDPDYFLGGQVKLNRDRALAVLEETIAQPLGLDVYQAGAGVLEVINTQMRELLATMVATKGYNTHDFSLLYYGGAGPVHMWGFTEGIEFADVITLPWAAGFSAFGAACSEYMHRYDRGVSGLIPNGVSEDDRHALADNLRLVWANLEAEARAEMEHEGVDSSLLTFRYGFSARYIGQLESFETTLPSGRMDGAADIQNLIDAFEDMYTKVYPEGARFPDAGYSITSVNLEAVAPKPRPVLHADELAGPAPSPAAFVETRKAYHRDKWLDFKVWEMAELKAGNVVEGPAIIRDPMTTVIVPPGKRMEFDKYRILHYR